jgi:SAM-dependent methyltransferase
MPSNEYPNMSQVLPSMASAEVQNNWTGNNGYPLLRQTLNFVRTVNFNFSAITGRSLKNTNILDFGCGYGRIARLMYYYTSPDNIFGVDPWDESIRLCAESRLPGNFSVSDYVLRTLPFPDQKFDLIYCFSVFTHLSEKTTRFALNTLRKYISPEGMLVITIRPEEYWLVAPPAVGAILSAQQVLEKHRNDGFAFVPHDRNPIDGDITYGDTSMTLSWLEREFPQWKIRAHDRTLDDAYQILVFLTPR